MEFFLFEAYHELVKARGSNWSIYDDQGYHSGILAEIASAMTSWAFGVKELVDTRNWNLDNLQQEYHADLRNPVAYFDLFITSKGNLALNWYPTKPFQTNPPLEKTDWRYWDSTWPQQRDLPFNRVFMIRGFGRLFYRLEGESYEKIDECLFRATEHLINDIYAYLSYFVEVEEITRLYLTYEERKRRSGRGMEHKLVGAEIRNVEEVERECALLKKKEWIFYTCNEFGISPHEFLEVFKANGMRYAPTAKQISTKSAKLTPQRAKKLVREIYGIREVYDLILTQPPPGLESRKKKGELIEVDFAGYHGKNKAE